MNTPVKLWWNPSKSLWYARVTYAPGRDSRHSLQTADRAEAEIALEIFRAEKLPAILAKHNRGAITEHDESAAGPKLQDVIRWYITGHLPFIERAQKTIDAYDRVLHDLLTFCRLRHVGRVAQLSTRIIQEWQVWQAQQRKSKETTWAKRDELLCVRNFLNVAHEAGEIKDLPKIKWDIPAKKKSQRFRAITPTELAAIGAGFHEERPPFRLPVLWMLYTGWLPSDTVDFRIREDRGTHIDRDRIKTARQMLFPVTPEMRELIDQATANRKPLPNDCVFLNRHGDPWTYHELEKQWRYWSNKRGLDISFRDFRVTYGSMHAAAGVPMMHLAELMTHSDPALTAQYYVRVDIDSLTNFQKRHNAAIAKLLNERNEK